MADQQQQFKELKPWRYRLERVSKGFVRVTLNSDNIQELLDEWKQIHLGLEQMGEKIERVIEEDSNDS